MAKTIELKSVDVNYKQAIFIFILLALIIFGILFGMGVENDNPLNLIIGIIGIIISVIIIVLIEERITSEDEKGIGKKDILIIIIVASIITTILILKYTFNLI